MTAAVTDRRQTLELARTMAGRVAELIRPLQDTSPMVPGTEWTIGEHGAHLAYTKDLMARMVAGEALTHGDGSREGFTRANMETLGAYPERNGAVLADRIEAAVETFCRTVERLPAGTVRSSPLGPITTEVYSSYVLAHLMMHGQVIARALRKPGVMDKASVVAATPFLFLSMERFVDPVATRGLTASYALHVRGGPSLYIVFDDGSPRFSQNRIRRVDCHVSADPVALMMVGVRIIEQWGPIATFKLTTWGPKPWLAFRFAGLFLIP